MIPLSTLTTQTLTAGRALAQIVSVLSLLMLAGCSGGGGAAGPAEETASQDAELRAATDRLNEMFQKRRGELAGGTSPNRRDYPAPVIPPPDFSATIAPPATPAAPAALPPAPLATASDAPFMILDPAPPAGAETTPPPPLPSARRSTGEFLDFLQERSRNTPMGEAVRLALLESIEPGASGPRLREAQARLSPAQQVRLESFRALLDAFSTADEDSAEKLARRLRDEAATIASERGLRIPTAALVKRVEAFGRYTGFVDNRFLAGRAQPALVYVEVEDFGFKPFVNDSSGDSVDNSEAWVIEIAQELRLYHDPDGVLAWRSREVPIRDVSRRKRTDHYLVQRIELPATLTVGAYNLKVILRDLTTGGSSEAVIPIQVVADPALAQSGSK